MIQIPSKFRNIPQREWSVDLNFDVNGGIYGVDQSQRLLVVTEKKYGDASF